MTAYKLSVMKNTLLSNTNKIKQLEEENKQLLEDIENYDNYVDNKLEEFNNTLKEVVNIQKQFNKLVSDKQSPITNKYLPLPYDINEIIRKNVIKGRKLQVDKECLEYYYYLRDLAFQNRLLRLIGTTTTGLYDYNALGNTGVIAYIHNVKRELENLWENTKDMEDTLEYEWQTFRGNNNIKWCIKSLIQEYPEIVRNNRDKFVCNYRFIMTKLIDLLTTNVETENNKVVSFMSVLGERINIRKNNKKNGMGFNKLKKHILDIFKEKNMKCVEDHTYTTIKSEWTDYEWESSGFECNNMYEKVEEDFKDKILKVWRMDKSMENKIYH